MELRPHQVELIKQLVRDSSSEQGHTVIVIGADGNASRLALDALRHEQLPDRSDIIVLGAGHQHSIPAPDMAELIRSIPMPVILPSRDFSMHEGWSRPRRRIAQWKSETGRRRC